MIELLNDESYMKLALQMNEQAIGQTGVNPAVGCVVVNNGRIVGLGAHLRQGEAHAEVHALNMAGIDAHGSTVYVTLEPCSHFGRTPPCADRLIQEGVRRVVIACLDPNPLVSGNGAAKLAESGIEVKIGVLEQEAAKLNESYIKYIKTGMPFVTLKSACTLDGKIATDTGDSKWISSAESREIVHTMRHRHQAIMAGIGTVLADNPRLTARLAVPAVQPVRIIVDSKLRMPLDSELVRGREEAHTIVLTAFSADDERQARLEQLGAQVIRCGNGDKVDLKAAMKELGQRQIGSILLEGGGRLNGAMLEAKLIDKIVLFVAPKIVGGRQAPGAFMFSGFDRMNDAIHIKDMQIERIGGDVCMTGYPVYESEAASCSPG